jgi:broad specificity phosphatase PhoE
VNYEKENSLKIYLIRHGRQDSVGCNENAPLSKIGKEQAKLLGNRLFNYPIDGLYSSDLIRAVETTQIAYQRMQALSKDKLVLEHMVREGIREFNFGTLTGQSEEDLKDFYKEYYKMHKAFSQDMVYPGGEGGEQVVNRAMPVIEEIAHSGLKHVAVVMHGGTIRALLSKLFIDDVSKRLLFATSLENTGITELYYNENRQQYYLERFNDYAHIEHDKNLLRN